MSEMRTRMCTEELGSVASWAVLNAGLTSIVIYLHSLLEHYYPCSTVSSDPVAMSAWLCAFYVMLCWLVSVVANNYSQVDKLWSIVPFAYVWVFAWYSQWNSRLLVMAIVSSVWGARLTYNFARRGGYSWKFWSGEEDYRWALLKQDKFIPGLSNPFVWQTFNFGFVALYQHVLLLLIVLPAAVAYKHTQTPLNWLDVLLAVLFLAVVWAQKTADGEQFLYQTRKHTWKAENHPPVARHKDCQNIFCPEPDCAAIRGFCTDGLWGLSRHPNYTCEQSLWVLFYLFSVSAGGPFLNWSVSGCLLLISLFVGSTILAEQISGPKYKLYAVFQAEVAKVAPTSFWLAAVGLFALVGLHKVM